MTALKPKTEPDKLTWAQRAQGLYLRNLFGRSGVKCIGRAALPHEGKREVARRERQIERGQLAAWEGEL